MLGLAERYGDKVSGVLSCFDRVVITGTLPDICHAKAMARYLRQRQIRLFDYTGWAEPLREQIRANAERVASAAGIEIEFVRRSSWRKEDIIRERIDQRGSAPGLVHILSAMETCPAYRPWHDKKTHQTFVKPVGGKCLHYYFYFIDEELGLCYLRVPTWAPFRLQFYFNGHNVLAAELRRHGIDFTMADNALVEIADIATAQRLADGLSAEALHRRLDHYAATLCPVLAGFPAGYHWSIMQAEYATDIVFKKARDLAPLYEGIVYTAIHAVKADNVATFLGRRLSARYQGEAGTDFQVRMEGTCVKHHMGPASIKMYDKRGRVLRIETTVNDVSFFKHHRRVEHRDGRSEMKNAPVKKTIYSLGVLRELLGAANRRYLDFVSNLDDHDTGRRTLHRTSKPVREGKRTFRGFNFFDADDLELFRAVVRGEHVISGFTNRALRKSLSGKSAAQIGRMLKRLRTHGLIKKVGRSYKYYLTKLGRHVITTGLKMRELVLIPSLSQPTRL